MSIINATEATDRKVRKHQDTTKQGKCSRCHVTSMTTYRTKCSISNNYGCQEYLIRTKKMSCTDCKDLKVHVI